ncbi:MAG: hypothetical protein AAGI23_20880 [Bacteroidota bacterium]
MTNTNTPFLLLFYLLFGSQWLLAFSSDWQTDSTIVPIRIEVLDSTLTAEELRTVSFFLEDLNSQAFEVIPFYRLRDSLSLPSNGRYRIELHSFDNTDHFFFLQKPIEFSTPAKDTLLVRLLVGDGDDYLVETPSRVESAKITKRAVSKEPDIVIKGVDDSPPQKVEFDSVDIANNIEKLTDEELRTRITARIFEYIPDTMYVEEREKLSIVLSADTTATFFNEFVNSDPLFEDNEERVKSFLLEGVGNIMISRLIDVDSAFSIQPLFAQDQRFIDFFAFEPQRWEWYVTPRMEGEHLLTYALERIDIIEDKEFTTSITPVFEKPVLVVIKGGAPVEIPEEESNFLWGWIAIIVGVLGVVIFTLLRSRKKQQQKASIRIPSQDIRQAIAEGKPEKALDLLSASSVTLPKDWQREITMLQARWASLESDLNKGTIAMDKAQIERNRIKDRILDVIDELSKNN